MILNSRINKILRHNQPTASFYPPPPTKQLNLHRINYRGIAFELVSGLLGNLVEEVVEWDAKNQDLKNLEKKKKSQQSPSSLETNAETYGIHIARIAIIHQASRLQKGCPGSRPCIV
jgi:hypothetical protein